MCRPSDRKTIAEITHAKERKIVRNYGAVNELTLSIPYKITDKEGQLIDNPVVSKIYGDYLIRLESPSEYDYYIITTPEYSMDNDGSEYLSLTCYQQQYELKNKIVRAFQGTYKLYDPLGGDSVLSLTLTRQTDWTVEYIDPSLALKYRTFDTSEDSLLEFLFNAIDTYGNYVLYFNTVTKKVSIYLEEEFGSDNGLSIEHGKYLKSLKETDKFDEVVTRLFVYGDDDLSINSINPSGTSYLENYSFYTNGYQEDENGNVISHSVFMSDGLCKALKDYDSLLQIKQLDFNNLLQTKNDKQTLLTTKNNELFELNADMAQLQDDLALAISNNGDQVAVNAQIASKQLEINAKNSEIAQVNTDIGTINTQITQLRNLIAVENNFTPAQLIEKNHFTKEKTWSDSNYTDVSELYAQAETNLQLWSQPNVVYETDIINILSALNANPNDKVNLWIGSVINIFYPNFNINLKAKIISMTQDLDGTSLSITLANTKDIKTGFLKLKDLLNRSASTSTTVDMNKVKWNQSENNTNLIQNILESKWDANKNAIEGGSSQQYTLDAHGLTIKSPTDPLRILRAVNSVLAISNDGGNTYRSAIDADGVHAAEIIGQLVAGEYMTFTNASGDFLFDDNGVTIDGAKMTFTNSLPSQINDLFTDMQTDLSTLNDYVDGAFQDGIVEQSEANSIQTHLNTLGNEKSNLDSKFNSLYNNAALTGTPKTDLLAAKNAYDLSYSNLVDSINSAIADGKTTTTEKAVVDAKFADYQTKLSALSAKFESALDYIAGAYAGSAETNSQAYADSLKEQTDADIADIQTNLNNLDSYVDGAFSDGIIQQSEATAIAKYLNILITEKSDIDARYTQLDGNAILTGAPKTNLYQAKSDYDTSHTNLINSINTAIEDGKTTTTEKSDVDSKFTDYKTKLTTLTTRFEEAVNFITQTSATNAENNAKNTSVQKGTGYNSVVIDSNGVVATHADGSTTSLSVNGLLRIKAGSVTKPYNYLSYTGSAETGATGSYFDNGGARYASGTVDGGGIPNVTITLPADFQGKNFTVAVSVKSSAPYTMSQRDGDSYYPPYVDLGNYLEVVSTNSTLGTFTVKGYGNHMILGSDGASLYTKYWAIGFSYMVVA